MYDPMTLRGCRFKGPLLRFTPPEGPVQVERGVANETNEICFDKYVRGV